jgi:SNF2 domain-containing protein/helicase-like protein/restriction endonuclease
LDWVLVNNPTATVAAEADGVVITHNANAQSSASSRLERILPALLLQLEDMEIGFPKSISSWCIPYAGFVELESKGIDAFEGICKWSPLTLELESTRWLGAPDFRYRYRFYHGSSPATVERRGCFIAFHGTLFRLDADCFNLIEAIDEYNHAQPEDRAKNALLQFSKIKGLATSIGANLDRYLSAERVLLPSKLGVDIVPEPDGRISFVPKVEGVPQHAMTRAFFAFDDIETVYAVDDESGGRIRVIFDEAQQEVLRRIQRVRHVGGHAKAKVMRDPASVFDGVSGGVEFAFGPRVTGVGDFPFAVKPYIEARTGILDGVRPAGTGTPECGIECRYVDGSCERVRFSSRQELLQFRNQVAEARSRGIGTVDLNNKTIAVDSALESSLDELISIQSFKPTATKAKPSGRYVLIYTNEAQLEYEEPGDRFEPTQGPNLPQTFVGQPKRHQIAGYRWLRRSYQRDRSGCLLADDMGLGKTLQVLLFLAAQIEMGALSDDESNPDLPPWNPILIVAPVILIENGTWQSDMQLFFADEGSVFEPVLVLHGATLKGFRSPDLKGRETELGQAALRLEELRKFKVILTNYDTVVNYQHSLARIRWSAVVTDEAQEYKTPSTKVSHALKALNAKFRVACTGTPVETRLFDIWNLFDFLQPGPLLGSATDFRSNYEPSVQEAKLSKLKDRLKLGTPDAYLLRRNKEDALELPPKHEHYLESELSQAQVNWHIDLLNRRSENAQDSHPFSILHSLMVVYQHPLLMPRFEPSTPDEAIRTCPKLASVIQCLREIRQKSEKALIFTRSIDMQQLLALTIEHVFGFRVHIVNGATGRDERRGINNTRRSIVDSFRKSSGFNVLILSPDVAGIGLTIVEANHVIHYGRWWNPATESQATDRVYRIGQAKPVHVYYPVSRHPQRAFPTFDEKLDELLTRRKQLAADFLAPMPSEDELQRELLGSLGVSSQVVPPQQIIVTDDLSRMTWDRFESLIALIEEKYGRQVWLSPKSGDGGIDVVARIGSELRLIQCKHTQWTSAVDTEMVLELINSCDAFRASMEVTGFTLRPLLITNASVPRGVAEFARNRDVEVIGAATFSSYLGNLQCPRSEVEGVERQRYSSLARMKHDLADSLRAQTVRAKNVQG